MSESKAVLEPIELDAYKSLGQVVSDTLRQAIKDGVLKPGERIFELDLAAQLGVSRTPIRDAIKKLALEGFVVNIERRGTYVANISLKEISQVFEIRTALEELAAGLAAERITPEEIETLELMLVEISKYMESKDMDKIIEADVHFHDVLYKASRNNRLSDIIHNLREQTLRFRSISMNQPGRLSKTWEEHREMVEAISDHNAAHARKIARTHMEHSEQTLINGLNKNKEVESQIEEVTGK